MRNQMTQASFRDMTVGQIAATVPGATRVFREFKLDFCCGGDVPLREAAARNALDINCIEERLAALDPASAPETATDTVTLIDHILSRYHETHRQELPELVRLSRRVEAVHNDHPDAPRGLASTLEGAYQFLDDHMRKEEAILFPAMKAKAGVPLGPPITQMRHDHDGHADLLHQLERLTNGFTPPSGACRSWRALYAGVAKFVDDVKEHIHLENNVLFPRFE